MQRPDAQMVRAALKAKCNGKKDIEYSLSLPFMYFADQEHMDVPWLQDPYIELIKKELEIRPSEWMFNEFVMMFKSRGVYSRHDFTHLTRDDNHPLVEILKNDSSIKSLLTVWTWDQRIENPKDFSYIQTLWKIYDGKITCDRCKVDLSNDFSSINAPKQYEEQTAEQRHIIAESIGPFIQTVQAMHDWLKHSDKHPVEVTPVKKPKLSPLNKDKPWRRATGPRILFLDRMPTTQTESTGTHASPKPHRRRGHWRELSHPRYRHHPQYKQKIWVKPSFIGPEQTVYESNLYRLIKPLDELLAA
jgi:hypothetical protein